MMERRDRSRPPVAAAVVLTLALGLGTAFLHQGARRQVAEQRAVATTHAADLASGLERRLSALFTLAQGVGSAPAADLAVAREAEPALSALVVAPAGAPARVATAGDRALATSVAAVLTARLAAATAAAEPSADGRLLLGPLRPRGAGTLFAAGVPRDGGAGGGWTYAVASFEDLLAGAGFPQVVVSGHDYRLSRETDGRRRLVARSGALDLSDPVRIDLAPPGGGWSLAMAPRGGWLEGAPLITGGVLVVLMAILAALLTYEVTRAPAELRRKVEDNARRLAAANRRLMEEVEQRRRVEEQLRHDAFHDGLTKLPNRGYFLDWLDRALERARRNPGYQLAVLFLDADRFKNVNDSLGHAAGDELLVAIARRLERCVRPQDAVTRLGGDEFALLLFDVGSPDAAVAAAERVHTILASPFRLGGQEVFVTTSIGIAMSSSGYDASEELLRDADVAMYYAKSQGPGRTEVFSPAMREKVVAELEMETDLRRAIDRGELELVYQPIVELASGEVAGFEALVRWQHPLEGRLSPARFLRLAEETGLIVSIDRWVLERACVTAAAWRSRLPGRPFTMSVNLSGRDLRHADTGDFVARVVAEAGLPPEVLRLEITESEIIENVSAASELLPRLHQAGVAVALDDFGTGYSSLSYLHRFHFDLLKIDRSFVHRMLADERDASIVRAVVALAQTLGMKTVAEGVETAEQREALHALGCDYGQGFLYSRPLEAAQAEASLVEALAVAVG